MEYNPDGNKARDVLAWIIVIGLTLGLALFLWGVS